MLEGGGGRRKPVSSQFPQSRDGVSGAQGGGHQLEKHHLLGAVPAPARFSLFRLHDFGPRDGSTPHYDPLRGNPRGRRSPRPSFRSRVLPFVSPEGGGGGGRRRACPSSAPRDLAPAPTLPSTLTASEGPPLLSLRASLLPPWAGCCGALGHSPEPWSPRRALSRSRGASASARERGRGSRRPGGPRGGGERGRGEGGGLLAFPEEARRRGADGRAGGGGW